MKESKNVVCNLFLAIGCAQRIWSTVLCGLVTASAVGCWTGEEPELPTGNAQLGIVTFIEEEIGDQTTLRGLSVEGNEVARLDLVHARFTVTAPFTEDYATPEIDGRKLDV